MNKQDSVLPIGHFKNTASNRMQVISRTLSRRQLIGGMISLGAILATYGCSSLGAGASESVLLERASKYWGFVGVNDMISAWPYENVSRDPAWTIQNYLRRGGGLTYDSVKVLGVKEVSGDTAVVSVQIKFSLPQLKLKDQLADVADTWKLIDGVWYHVLRRNSLFEK